MIYITPISAASHKYLSLFQSIGPNETRYTNSGFETPYKNNELRL